jgi:DNA invertase Pin-like site-specific DNA recombinase
MTKTTVKKVCLYARVSTKEQDCERQLIELREVAENHNYEVVAEYVDEGISGAKKSRPALDQMLKDAMSRKFAMVMTLELSRLGRSVKNMCEIVEILKSKKIDLFIRNQNICTDTIVGEFFFNIINSISQYDLQLTRERIMSGLENARKKGRIGGRPTNLNDETKNKIVEMKRQKIGLKKIAAETKCGVPTIRKFLKEVA